jgi:hypothetical protein
MMLRDPATNEIPRGIRQREMEFARTLPTKEAQSSLNKGQAASWISRGPWNVGGRTRALGIDVSNVNVILAGGVSGGMWRSADGGATWSKRTAPGSLHSVTCLAQDRRTGQTATWYYGTGELLGNSASGGGAGYRGDGCSSLLTTARPGRCWRQPRMEILKPLQVTGTMCGMSSFIQRRDMCTRQRTTRS